MKRRLQALYWRGILITLIMAAAAIAMASMLKYDDTRNHLTAMLQAASRWTLDSNEDLQVLADSIAGVSPELQVTFLHDSGLVLADSLSGADYSGSHYDDKEIVSARNDAIGRDTRMSQPRAAFVLYMAQRVSPQLILRVSYPIFEIDKMLLLYGVLLLTLFFVLYHLQRSGITKFQRDQQRQMEDVRRLLDGELTEAKAVFPEFQPDLDAISYRIRRLFDDQREILRTMNLRNDFVANASHELRSPLTSVRGFAEMLEEGLAETPEERELCIRTIRSECDRMLEVIDQILQLSKAQKQAQRAAGQKPAAPIAEEVRQSLSPRAAKKNIELRVEGDVELPATEREIWEILYNLMDNAIRYGRDGGHVLVKMAPGQIIVEDDGIGIAREHLSKIFEQFYRVDEARESGAGGTGLGLSIVRAIVTNCGGTIRVESRLGEGSRFLLDFGSED